MQIYPENITFIIVCFKSEKVIFSCLNSLPRDSYKLIIENSNNFKLKKELEGRYKNLEVIINNQNSGFGASNNLGIKKSRTPFAYVLNPDVKFKEDTMLNITKATNNILDFTLLSPIHIDKKFPNYGPKKEHEKNLNDLFEVDEIDGFSMLINKNKFTNDEYFDENFFLYLENNDLCLRVKRKKEKIYIINNSKIDHLGGSSSDPKFKSEINYTQNWHWMWSKFYFNKKHYGYLNGFFKIFRHMISAFFKFLFYSIFKNHNKKSIYKARFYGCINGLLLKSSSYRPKI